MTFTQKTIVNGAPRAAAMPESVTVTVEYRGERERFVLSPKVRINCDVLGNIPHGTTLFATPPRAMKALITHFDNVDESFDTIWASTQRMLTFVQTWVLAGSLQLHNVQDRLVSKCRDRYLELIKRRRIPQHIDPQAIEYIRAAFKNETSKIELFLVCFYAGLCEGDLQSAAVTGRLRSSDRHLMQRLADRMYIEDHDFIILNFEKFKVGSAGDPVRAPVLHLMAQNVALTMAAGGATAFTKQATGCTTQFTGADLQTGKAGTWIEDQVKTAVAGTAPKSAIPPHMRSAISRASSSRTPSSTSDRPVNHVRGGSISLSLRESTSPSGSPYTAKASTKSANTGRNTFSPADFNTSAPGYQDTQRYGTRLSDGIFEQDFGQMSLSRNGTAQMLSSSNPAPKKNHTNFTTNDLATGHVGRMSSSSSSRAGTSGPRTGSQSIHRAESSRVGSSVSSRANVVSQSALHPESYRVGNVSSASAGTFVGTSNSSRANTSSQSTRRTEVQPGTSASRAGTGLRSVVNAESSRTATEKTDSTLKSKVRFANL